MRYAIINTSTTLDTLKGKESLDLALMLASFEFEVSLFFIGDGVYQTISQQPELVAAKDYPATFKALGFYDIENIFICNDSLVERNLTSASMLEDAEQKSSAEIAELINQHDVCLRF